MILYLLLVYETDRTGWFSEVSVLLPFPSHFHPSHSEQKPEVCPSPASGVEALPDFCKSLISGEIRYPQRRRGDLGVLLRALAGEARDGPPWTGWRLDVGDFQW